MGKGEGYRNILHVSFKIKFQFHNPGTSSSIIIKVNVKSVIKLIRPGFIPVSAA